MSAKLIFTKGSTVHQTGKLKSTRAVSQKIKDELKGLILKGNAEEIQKAAQKLAIERRSDYIETSRAYYLAMVNGAINLIIYSGVPAQSDAGVRVDVKRVKRGDVKISQGRYVRASFTAKIHHSEKLRFVSKPYGISDSVSVSLSPKWKKLSAAYAARNPESKFFFRKRRDTDPDSARVAFNSVSAAWKQKAWARSSYQKEAGISFTYDAGKGKLTTQLRINFPGLGPQFDFLRKAFLSGQANIRVPQLGGDGAAGIARAEEMRPMLRPFAVEVGKQWRMAINEELNNSSKNK